MYFYRRYCAFLLSLYQDIRDVNYPPPKVALKSYRSLFPVDFGKCLIYRSHILKLCVAYRALYCAIYALRSEWVGYIPTLAGNEAFCSPGDWSGGGVFAIRKCCVQIAVSMCFLVTLRPHLLFGWRILCILGRVSLGQGDQ